MSIYEEELLWQEYCRFIGISKRASISEKQYKGWFVWLAEKGIRL